MGDEEDEQHLNNTLIYVESQVPKTPGRDDKERRIEDDYQEEFPGSQEDEDDLLLSAESQEDPAWRMSTPKNPGDPRRMVFSTVKEDEEDDHQDSQESEDEEDDFWRNPLSYISQGQSSHKTLEMQEFEEAPWLEATPLHLLVGLGDRIEGDSFDDARIEEEMVTRPPPTPTSTGIYADARDYVSNPPPPTQGVTNSEGGMKEAKYYVSNLLPNTKGVSDEEGGTLDGGIQTIEKIRDMEKEDLKVIETGNTPKNLPLEIKKKPKCIYTKGGICKEHGKGAIKNGNLLEKWKQ